MAILWNDRFAEHRELKVQTGPYILNKADGEKEDWEADKCSLFPANLENQGRQISSSLPIMVVPFSVSLTYLGHMPP